MRPGLALTSIVCLLLAACSGRLTGGTDIPPNSGAVAFPTPPATATEPPPTSKPTSSLATAPLARAIIAPATKTPRPLHTPTKTPSPQPIPTSTPVDWLNTVGRTEDQLITLGNPNAPVTMIDYSDFM